MTSLDIREMEMTAASLSAIASKLTRAAQLLRAADALARAEERLREVSPAQPTAVSVAHVAQPTAIERRAIVEESERRVTPVDSMMRRSRGLAVFDAETVEDGWRYLRCEEPDVARRSR